MFDMFAGGALSRMSIFALNIMPYISASIIIQLMSSTSSHLAQLKKDGKVEDKKLLSIQDMEQFFSKYSSFGYSFRT